MVKLINDNNEYYWVQNFLDKDIYETITATHKKYDDGILSAEWLKELIEKVIKEQTKDMSVPIAYQNKVSLEDLTEQQLEELYSYVEWCKTKLNESKKPISPLLFEQG